MTLSFKDLNEHAGLDTDGASGFEAQIATRSHKRKALAPPHLRGTRLDNFEQGANLARDWMAMRKGVGTARRSIRAAELKKYGGTTSMRATTAAELHREQVETLRQIASLRNRIRKAIEDEGA